MASLGGGREPQDGTLPGSAAPLPSRWVRHFLSGVPVDGHVVDFAAGSGRHTRLALAAGHRVTAIDRKTAQLASIDHPNLTVIAHDLEDGGACPVRPGTADGVLVTNYLWRPILADIIATVADTGILIYETFGVGQARFGKPSNPDYLLRAGELTDAVAGRLAVIAAAHTTEEQPDRVVSRIVAVGCNHPWIASPPAPFR